MSVDGMQRSRTCCGETWEYHMTFCASTPSGWGLQIHRRGGEHLCVSAGLVSVRAVFDPLLCYRRDAFSHIQERRFCINPNVGFVHQLQVKLNMCQQDNTLSIGVTCVCLLPSAALYIGEMNQTLVSCFKTPNPLARTLVPTKDWFIYLYKYF